MRPFINWAGSREKDLGVILPLIPKDIETFVDPFVGDGACFLAAEAKSYAVADKNAELINAYRVVQTGGPRLRTLLPELKKTWENCDLAFENILAGLLELKRSADDGLFAEYPSLVKAVGRITDRTPVEDIFPSPYTDEEQFLMELRHQTIEALESMTLFIDDTTVTANFYTAFKAAVHQYLVEVFNLPETKNTLRAALLIFLMEYARGDKYVEDAQQFRPEYAGRKANQRNIDYRIETIMSPVFNRKMAATRTYSQELFRTLGYPFSKEEGNFLFLDIPGPGPKTLTATGHKRLAKFLHNDTKARWMVICDPNNPMVDMLYEKPKKIRHAVPLGKELIIMNY